MKITKETTQELARWGLPLEEIEKLGERLNRFCEEYRPYLRTQTRDTSEYGFSYLKGLLRMESKRTMVNIGRETKVSSQNLHHFMSNSPWKGEELLGAVQKKVAIREELQGGMLLIDESAEEKSGRWSAGAGRQHNGRLGKIEMSQVGVFASIATPQVNTWIDGALFFPKHWFEEEATELRQKVGMPVERNFQTKPQLAWEIIKRVRANGVVFEGVAMDSLYGRNGELRAKLEQAGIEYYGDVPSNTKIYLCQPKLIYPKTKKGKLAKRPLILGVKYEVQDLLYQPQLNWQRITIRPNEQGFLKADFARLPVWTIHNNSPRREWLLIRQDTERVTFILSNASWDTPLETMAWRKSHRYFVERSNQDAKSELGWDDFQATKYQAWLHHLALTILASWFITEVRLDWASLYHQDPLLLAHYQVDVLPFLSVPNMRTLLRAAIPLPQLSPSEAALLVSEHFVNRIRSRKSRLRCRPSPYLI